MQNDITDAIYAIQGGVVQAREGVTAVAEVDNYLVDLKKSNIDVFSRIKEIIKAINVIELDCKQSLESVQVVAELQEISAQVVRRRRPQQKNKQQ